MDIKFWYQNTTEEQRNELVRAKLYRFKLNDPDGRKAMEQLRNLEKDQKPTTR